MASIDLRAVLIAIADVTSAAGDLDEGVFLLELAARNYPGSGVVLARLGFLHWRLGRVAEARATLGKAIAIDANVIEAYVTLAQVEVESGNLEKAAETLELGLRRSPQDHHLLNGRARVYLATAEPLMAHGCALQSLVVDPTNVTSWSLLAEAAAAAGESGLAARISEKALSLRVSSPVVADDSRVARGVV